MEVNSNFSVVFMQCSSIVCHLRDLNIFDSPLLLGVLEQAKWQPSIRSALIEAEQTC